MLKYDRAKRMLQFIEQECGLTIMKWIREFVMETYATDSRTGKRVRTRALLSCGRKNGKTELLGACFLGHLIGPEAQYHPAGSEFVSAAGGSKEQASLVYDSMRGMIERNPRMAAVTQITANTIYRISNLSYFKFLPTSARSTHGMRPALWGYDELAQAKDGALLDALDRGQGAVAEPLGFVVSTNSTRPGQPLAELIASVQRAKAAGRMKHWVCHVYAADPEAVEEDPLHLDHVKAANPSYGQVLSRDSVRREREEARTIPTKMTYYRSYRLNLDIDEHAAFVDIHKWRACADPKITLESMRGRKCIVSVDLSISTSLSSVALYFPDDEANLYDGGKMIVENWIPELAMPGLAEEHGADYRGWKRAGLVRTTQGSAIELDEIVDRLVELEGMFDIVDLRRDSARVRELESKLEQRNTSLQARFVRQGYMSLGPASDTFIKLISNGKLRHNDNPVTNMCLRNTAGRPDRSSTSPQVKPIRLMPHLPIDATVAMVECLMHLEPVEQKGNWFSM